MPERVNRREPAPEPPPDPVVDPLVAEDLDLAAQPSVQHIGDSVTTGTIPMDDDAPARLPRPVRTPLYRWLTILLALCLLLGAVAGVVWERIVPLSLYHVNADRSAATTERGLAGFVAGDAWFVVIGVVVGALLAVVCWRWFAGLGWPMVPLAILASTFTALVCWQVGWWLGPGSFESRLAAAQPGQDLPIELTVRGPAAVLVWPFATMLVTMLIAAAARDPESR